MHVQHDCKIHVLT